MLFGCLYSLYGQRWQAAEHTGWCVREHPVRQLGVNGNAVKPSLLKPSSLPPVHFTSIFYFCSNTYSCTSRSSRAIEYCVVTTLLTGWRPNAVHRLQSSHCATYSYRFPSTLSEGRGGLESYEASVSCGTLHNCLKPLLLEHRVYTKNDDGQKIGTKSRQAGLFNNRNHPIPPFSNTNYIYEYFATH